MSRGGKGGLRFSPRTPADLSPNSLSLLVDRLRGEGRALVDLTASNPTAVGLPYPEAELAEALAAGATAAYAPSARGLLSARRAVAEAMGARAPVDPEHLFLTASTSEAYGFLFKLLCAPGDQVLVPRPSYPLFEHLCRLDAVDARSYALGPAPGFALDPDRVEVELGPRVRAVVVVSPNNPTGSVASAAALAELAGLCGERGIAIISDEVFADYPAGAGQVPSALAAGGALVAAMGGLSKSCGLPHYKLGWIALAGPPDVRDEAALRLDHIADAYLSASGPVMRALPRLLQLGAEIRRAIAGRVEASRAAAVRALAGEPSARLLPADGGWSAVIELGPETDEEQLALRMADEHDVLIQPGYFFDFDRGAHAVVSLLAPPGDIARGLAALCAALAGR
jgi:aspartate/methionine/tyrosine aminotransferase